MIIVAGHLRVEPSDRSAYLAAVSQVAVQARNAPGCLDFVQVADPVDTDRIHIYERWESADAVRRFRTSGGPEIVTPPVLAAAVSEYQVASVSDL